MNSIFELLERNDLIADGDAFKVFTERDQLSRFYRDLYKTVFDQQYDHQENEIEFDPFRYVASSSLRGDIGCWEPDCRAAKIDFLNRFAALYANRVAVPLVLSSPDRALEYPDAAAAALSHSLLTLLRSRPLIEAGIIRPTVMSTSHCTHELGEVRKLSEAAHEYALDLAKEFSEDFETIYQLPEKSPSGKSTVYLSGPAQFMEHDMVALFEESENWKLKSWRYDSEGKVRFAGPRKLRFVSKIFKSIAESTTFYLTYGLQHRARFLSDLPGEVILLEDFGTEDENFMESTLAMRELTHSLPLLGDLPLSTLLRIRKEDRESFNAYRFEIAAITTEVLKKGISEVEARDSLRSRIEPCILKIKQELKIENKKRDRYFGLGAASIAASVGIGLCGLPALAAIPLAATAAAVGARLIGKGSEIAVESVPESKKQNDLYFLARLVDEV